MKSKKYDKKFYLKMLNEENLKIKKEIRELKKIDCNIVKLVLFGISSILMFNFGAMFIFLNSVELRFFNSFGLSCLVCLMSISFIFSCLFYYYAKKIENKKKEFYYEECGSIYDD